MEGVVVSASKGVMDSVIVKLNDLVLDTCGNLIGLSSNILFLKNELPDMNALLKKLEGNEQLDPQVKHWRNQVLEMTYDIEDCIDDFRNNVRSADAKVGLISKVSDFLVTLKARFDTAMQIKELKARLQDISDRRKRYKVDDCTTTATIETLDARLPALYNEAASLVGIDNPKEEIIKWVLDEDQQLKVVSIVGTGGLGKTTLANEVYREVKGQFSCKAFVPVSRTPDITRILTSMLSQFGQDPISHACDVQYLVDNLIKYLQDKRYLIIVDDLWDAPPWNIIRCAFPPNDQHSRVIVTTRHVDVSKACRMDHRYIYHMQPLSETNSKKLLFKRLPVCENASHSQSSKVVCEILKKCGGLPLAVITIASILACQQPGRLKEQWESIQNSLSIQCAGNSTLEQMVQILDLSYKSLPQHLKSCFLYLGKYPEDHTISRNELIRQWVAEGFVRSSPGRDVWEIAEGYFNGLLNRSMIQAVYDAYKTEVLYCRVHDMMLDLILRKCGEDNFIAAMRDPQDVAKMQYKVRRLAIDMSGTDDVTRIVASKNLLSQVRSFAMFGGPGWIPPLLEFKFLRVLLLEFQKHIHRIELTCIIHMSQLRYLKIACNLSYGSYGQSIVLPSQMQSVQHLETLELPTNRDVNIPSDIVDLPHLSHLVVPRNTRLPDGIGKLSSLRTLVGYNLQTSSSENTRALGMLTNLVYMELTCGEWTDFEHIQSVISSLSSALEKVGTKLKRISIRPHIAFRGDALSSFSPAFHNLERLELFGVIFPRVPSWIGGLRDLRRLELGVDKVSNSNWEDIGILGVLPSLVFLWLRIPGVIPDENERIVISGTAGFAVLQSFHFVSNGISSLSFEARAMPNLRLLRLSFDPRVWDKAGPAGLENLSNLKQISATKAGRPPPEETRKEVEMAMDVLIRDVLQEAVEALPTRPAFTTDGGWLCSNGI